MKPILLFTLLVFSTFTVDAQRALKNERTSLKKWEDSLQQYSIQIVEGKNPNDRFTADSIFTKILVRALINKNSFYYPFNSLESISKLFSPDSSFKIFTWQMVINENMIRQHGAIQMKTEDGSLQLLPLIDKSDIIINQADTVTNNRSWMGAIYYKIIPTKNGNKRYYTLFGYDENNIRSTKKIIETLEFINGEPIFGSHLFNFEDNSKTHSPLSRFILEFKKNTGARVNYDSQLGMIIFEHLESESNEPTKKWTFIPDGDYEGFKWKNGKWIHINKVFNLITPEGKEPVPNPLKDVNGKIIEPNLKNNQPIEQLP
jgi:hypothetical protein